MNEALVLERAENAPSTPIALCPALYQINTRVWMTALSERLGRPATLEDIPDEEIDALADLHFDWIWLLSVWQTGAVGQRISRTNHEWLQEFKETLPDLRPDDIGGSGFAVTSYVVHAALGGPSALARLRERLRRRGLRLMLDFVPNHTAVDHPWVDEHVEYYVPGTPDECSRSPHNYVRLKGARGESLLAHGRDPNFPGWTDTLQLNYGNPATQAAMIGELRRIAAQCDGVRCDMAMLVQPDVFQRTWGIAMEPFWPKAIAHVREQAPDFRFMAEVYWDLEWAVLQQGFDYAYDKRLYDRLRAGHARSVREHLQAPIDYQSRLARFLENHDEPRAAATFRSDMHEAAAVVTYLTPGLRFFHQGQFEGRRRRISPHLVRGPAEPTDETLRRFYDRLRAIIAKPTLRNGEWSLLCCEPAWEGNWTHDCYIGWCWRDAGERRWVVAVNYAPNQSQCFLRLPWTGLAGRTLELKDALSAASYVRDGDDISRRGLYLDLPGWGYHAFEVSSTP